MKEFDNILFLDLSSFLSPFCHIAFLWTSHFCTVFSFTSIIRSLPVPFPFPTQAKLHGPLLQLIPTGTHSYLTLSSLPTCSLKLQSKIGSLV